ncbi:MAG: pilus assembly protein N-terminal domain-containing protein [Candidatus Obscuribacterales bacterium]|nr:pilus assembly protein N-terminal domain-containing protein [Candidatus Obscuribacterales bacterium]
MANTSADSVPSAALTIHPRLDPASVGEVNQVSHIDSEEALLSNAVTKKIEHLSEVQHSKEVKSDLLAQLAPDQIVAQSADVGGPTASPIPPVVTGTVDLEEFKTTNILDLRVGQSRTFKLRNKIVRTSISDPSIAEPVVVSENQLVLLGKTPGNATLVLWDDAGNSVAIDLRVARDYSQLQTTLREIDPRIIVKAFSVGGSDRVILLGDVDHPESALKAFAAATVFMDDRGMNIQVANNRLVNARIGEQGGAAGGAGGQAGQLAQLSSVDRYTFFPNTTNNLSKAQIITSDGGRVTSLVKVRKVPLIVLHVSFMEMNTSAARSLGVQLGFGLQGRNWQFGVGGNNNTGTGLSNGGVLVGTNGSTSSSGITPVAFTSVSSINSNTVSGIGQGVLNTATSLLSQSNLFGSPGGASFSTSGLGNLFTSTSHWTNGSVSASLNPTIQGLISQQRARVLAEPSLVTISGERAAFLAGGEIPILQSIATAGTSQQSVTFEPFGLRLNMIPVLMENGRINLEVAPEERIVSTQYGLNLAGSTTTIPGFTTRKSQTIVELAPGQELFISGLITANSGREITKIPVIGEVPILGALYRSKAFSKNESELVVAVRPEIILPGTPGQLKLPEEIGRAEGPRDTNLFQVEPTVIDERHYTSGRAERHQKNSPTLPEGSPIPDNE